MCENGSWKSWEISEKHHLIQSLTKKCTIFSSIFSQKKKIEKTCANIWTNIEINNIRWVNVVYVLIKILKITITENAVVVNRKHSNKRGHLNGQFLMTKQMTTIINRHLAFMV